MGLDVKGTPIVKGIGFDSFGLGSNACTVDIDRENDKMLRIRPFHFDEHQTPEELNAWKIEARGHSFEPGFKTLISPLSLCYKKRIYSKNRIPYPLKRVDWEPGGDPEKINAQNRGKSNYVRISWDEAAQMVADEIKRIHDNYGPLSVLLEYDGHGETKVVHAAHGCMSKMLDLCGGFTSQARQPDSWEGWYWGGKHIWGMDPLGQQNRQNNIMKDVSEHSDAVLFWGCDVETTPAGWGGFMGSRLCFWFTELGIKQIHISPDCNYTNAVHADKWIPVYPNTDAALQLAIAYQWLVDGTYDKEYLDTHAVGFDWFEYYVMGYEDGIPKTPKWASKICGVPSYTIKALARYWGTHLVSIAHCNGGSFIRSCFSHEPARLEVALLGMQGVGKPGVHQFKFMEWQLFGIPMLMPLPPSTHIPDLSAAYRGWVSTPTDSMIPKTMIPEAIMNPPITFWGHMLAGLPRDDQFVGPLTYPLPGQERVHMIWSDTPCWETCWNGGFTMQDALRHESIECLVVQHPWMENDTLFADIVLPSNTKFETADIGNDLDSGQWNLVYYEDQAIEPLYESKSDKEAVGEVAKKLEQYGGIYEDLYNRYIDYKTDEEWIRLGFEKCGAPESMSFEEFKEKKYYAFPTRPDWKEMPAGLWKFYNNPEKSPLKTPSGKIEYYSLTLAEHFPDDKERPVVPHWVEQSEEHQERNFLPRAVDYPFLLVSNHPHFRVHAQHDDVTWFREMDVCKVTGPDGYKYEPIWVNPIDAGKLGLKTGDIAKLYNERGGVMGGVMVTERIMPGVLYQDHGSRVDTIVMGAGGLDRGGANNLIAPTHRTSKLAFGEVTSGFLVNIEKVDVFELAQQYPEAFSRPYDKDCGLIADARILKEGE